MTKTIPILAMLFAAAFGVRAATQSNVLNEITKTNTYGSNAAARVGYVNVRAAELSDQIESLRSSISTLAGTEVVYPVTNNIHSDLSADWWRNLSSGFESDVVWNNGYSLVNPFDSDSGGYGWRHYTITAPLGASSVTLTARVKAHTSGDTVMRLALWNQPLNADLGGVNQAISTAHWTNAEVTVSVTAGSTYNVLVFSSSIGNCSQASFYIAGLDARWNNASNSPSFEIADRYIARNHKSKRDKPYPNSHFTFFSSASSLSFEVFSDNTADLTMRFCTILTNGVFAGNLDAVATNGIYTINFGSSALRKVTVYNGGVVVGGGVNGSWVRRVYSSDASIVMVLPDETADVLTMGDSMVAGFTVTNMANAWPSVLERNTGLRVETHAIGSIRLANYTNANFTTLRERVRMVNPKAIWLEYGYNDWANNSMTPTVFQTWYSNLTHCLLWEAPHARIYLQPILTYNASANAGGFTAADFRNAITNVAAMFPTRTTLVDWSALAASTEFTGVHPDDEGNLRWGMYAAELLSETLSNTNQPPSLSALKVNGLITTKTVTLTGTTNQVKFGITNSPPASTTIVKWISVQVEGETNAYRLGLAE